MLSCAALLAPWPARAVPLIERTSSRKTSTKDLAFEVERTQTKNGIVVLLSPDPRVSSVVVDITFRAGTIFEPPGRSGLAHLVEHLMMRGSTPDTDYIAILERRGCRYVNAFTTPGAMTFRAVVPREELPLALWVAGDRLTSLAGALTEADLDREKRVVAAERAQQFLDLPYAQAEMALDARLYPDLHPMRGSVLGLPKELEKTTLDEVHAFVGRYLVPANATLTITGAFDLPVAHKWIEGALGALPPGAHADYPAFTKASGTDAVFKVPESTSRLPRVTFAWRMSSTDLADRVLDSLEFGAYLLSIYTSGAFGTAVDAEFLNYGGEAVFRVDATLPYEKPLAAAQDEAEVYLRYLTRVPFPPELIEATLLARDRSLLFALDSPPTRATLITNLEMSGRDPTHAAAYIGRLWSADLGEVQRTAQSILGGSKLVMHAVPTRPRQPRVERTVETADSKDEETEE